MNVLFLRPQPAIRSIKYALAFKTVKENINIYHAYTGKTLNELYGYGDEHFIKMIKLDSRNLQKDLQQIVKDYKIHLIHSQNAPDFLTRKVIETVPNIPTIHENQDSISLRKTPYNPGAHIPTQLIDEKISNEECDARIHVSNELYKYIRNRYGPKPEIIFPNYISESLIPRSLKEKLSKSDRQLHIVYEGTLASYRGDHYDLREIFTQIASHRFHIHIYDSHYNTDYLDLAKQSEYIHYHGHLDPRDLLLEMSQYDFGWSGFNTKMNKEHIDVALPNKLFEYISCSLPVLSYRHKAQKKFIETENVGLTFGTINEMASQLKNEEKIAQIRREVLSKRYEFTVEKNIDKLIHFYKEVVASNSKKHRGASYQSFFK